jgi:hypothetical protein
VDEFDEMYTTDWGMIMTKSLREKGLIAPNPTRGWKDHKFQVDGYSPLMMDCCPARQPHKLSVFFREDDGALTPVPGVTSALDCYFVFRAFHAHAEVV